MAQVEQPADYKSVILDSDVPIAEAFLEFEYAETKDLAKQFVTVVAAILAVSVTFAEKVMSFEHAPITIKVFLILSWGLSLLALVLGGAGVFLIFNAGQRAKRVATRQPTYHYQSLARKAFDALIAAGGCFVLSLLLLVLVGVRKLF